MSVKAVSLVLTMFVLLAGSGGHVFCCDLEEYFAEKQVSVEERVRDAGVVFRGLSTNGGGGGGGDSDGDDGGIGGDESNGIGGAGRPVAAAGGVGGGGERGVYAAYFELIATYKGADHLHLYGPNREINVTIFSRPVSDCMDAQNDIPREYIVFCQLLDGILRATAIAKWDESTDQRVWTSLGWDKWSEWSACSVSCAAGIQQRTRRCLLREDTECPGFNVEQRHCNLFSCGNAVNPLAVEENRYYHPSKDHWRRVPDRPAAWRLVPNNYIWLPSTQLYNNASFPKEFSLFITLRLLNESLGTVFSLRSRRRQDTYLSLEVAGGDLKLIHATSNGTDVVRIPAGLDDHNWHQIAISIRDNSVVDNYVDCQWSRTNILKVGSLDIPEDSDLIIGYLFAGDLEQLTIDPDPAVVGLQCYSTITPIIDPAHPPRMLYRPQQDLEQDLEHAKNPVNTNQPIYVESDSKQDGKQGYVRNDFMHAKKRKLKKYIKRYEIKN